MVLINEDNVTETFYSSYANFEAQGESGEPAFITASDDLGTWMSTQPSITLQPGESQSVPFTVVIPKDATPGGHFAVIFWGQCRPTKQVRWGWSQNRYACSSVSKRKRERKRRFS